MAKLALADDHFRIFQLTICSDLDIIDLTHICHTLGWLKYTYMLYNYMLLCHICFVVIVDLLEMFIQEEHGLDHAM